MREARLTDPAEAQAHHRDAELAGRQVLVEVPDDLLRQSRSRQPRHRHLLQARRAHLHDGELGRYEERVAGDEEQRQDDVEGDVGRQGAVYNRTYSGPPPPSGGTQVMIWYGSMMSQVLQWTQ